MTVAAAATLAVDARSLLTTLRAEFAADREVWGTIPDRGALNYYLAQCDVLLAEGLPTNVVTALNRTRDGLARVNAILASVPVVEGWTPLDLGSAALEWWTARRLDLITQSGGVVSGWRGAVGARNAAQANGSQQPAYNVAGLNGRPALIFDGADDLFIYENNDLWTSNSSRELWGVGLTTAPGRMVTFGGGSNNNTRYIGQNASGFGTAGSSDGSSTWAATTAPLAAVAPFVLRGQVYAGNTQAFLNGTPGTPVLTPAGSTGNTRLKIGASHLTAPSALWQGPLADVLITTALTDLQAAVLLFYLKYSNGIA